jgi:hypothetical protein
VQAPLLQASVAPGGAALTSDRLNLLLPAGTAGAAGADFLVTPADAQVTPPLPRGLLAGDLLVNIALTDAASGQPLSKLTPPMTVSYAPSDAEMAQVGGDARRVHLALANGLGWESLMCEPTGPALTCSLPRPGLVTSVISDAAGTQVDFDLASGHFFTQRNGYNGVSTLGFSVLDDADAPMWSEFQRLGGADVLGFPISRRFLYHGSIVQAFENGVLQWMPDDGQAVLMNALDALSAAGDDAWLDAALQVPAIGDWSADAGLAPEDVTVHHLALLGAYPDLANALEANGSFDLYGLPTAVKTYGSTLVVRFQRATLQYWLANTGLAPAGTMVLDSGARLGKQVGLWPSEAMTPEAPPAVS